MIRSLWHSLQAINKDEKIAQVLAVELCLQCQLISATKQTTIHLFSPRIKQLMDLTIVLPTDIQWHDYNAFHLPNSTTQCEVIGMLHYHESCSSRFFLLCGLVGCKGSLCCGVYRVGGSLER
jgi:hypothetical protein